MLPRQPIVGIVIAAGKSARMGQPKHALKLGETTFVERIIGVYAKAGIRDFAVTVPDENLSPEILDRLSPYRIDYHFNAFPERGMLGSIQSLLLNNNQVANAGAILTCPVDAPFVSIKIVSKLLNYFKESGGNASIIAPSYKELLGHPILLSHRLFSDILALNNGDSIRTLMKTHERSIIKVRSEDPRILANINTPSDYALFTNPSDNIFDAAAIDDPGAKS